MRAAWEIFRTIIKRLRQAARTHPWTMEYPYVIRSLPVGSHTTLKNNLLDCTGCLDCEKVCPTKAITTDGFEYSKQMRRKQTSQGVPFVREIESFKIDYGRCVFCGLCVSACGTGSLSFSRNFARPETQAALLTVDLIHIPRTMRKGHNMERVHES